MSSAAIGGALRSVPGRRYRLLDCRGCGRGFAQVIRPGKYRTKCSPCFEVAELLRLAAAQRSDLRHDEVHVIAAVPEVLR